MNSNRRWFPYLCNALVVLLILLSHLLPIRPVSAQIQIPLCPKPGGSKQIANSIRLPIWHVETIQLQ